MQKYILKKQVQEISVSVKNNFMIFLGRAPYAGKACAFCFGSGYTLQVLIRYAHCGLSAAIPHADRCAYIYTHA